MNAIREWTTIICLAALASAMVELLTPNGRMERMVRFVLGAFLICAVLTPLLGTASKLTFDLRLNQVEAADNSAFQKKLDAQVAAAVTGNLKELTQEILQKEGVEAQKIEIFMDTGQDGSILINKMTVQLDKKDENRQVSTRKRLEEELGLPIEVIVNER